MSNDNKKVGFSTRAIHEGYNPLDEQGAIVPPIYMTSAFEFESAEQGAARFAGEDTGHFYTRISNPTLRILETRIAALEKAEAAISFASGMGAITSVLWTFLESGAEIIADKVLYGCTFAFMRTGLAKFGVKTTFVDMTKPEEIEAAITPNTKIIYFESPVNPNLRLVDIEMVAKIAKPHGIRTVIDNTYATPYLTQPLTLGADIVVHSATKYLGGHGDLVAGLAAGSSEDMARVRFEGLKDMTGAAMSPMNAFNLMRGISSLSVRMDRHCQSAMTVAKFLENHPAVESVNYPGLPSFPQYELAKRQMRQPGGMIAFELKGGKEAGVKLINSIKLIHKAISLGDTHSLMQHPASMSHSAYTPEERATYEISEGLVRLSVGLEDVEDIIADLEQALSQIK